MTRNTFLIWFLIALLAAIDTVWLWIKNMVLAPNAVLLIFLFVFGLAALAWVYTKIRPNPRIATMAHTASATLAFMCATCVLSYLAVTLKLPLVDAYLAEADRAIGLDWLAMYEWVRAGPKLHIAMEYVYMSLMPQIFLLQIVFSFRGQIARAWELLWMFVFMCLGCVFLSGLWPAIGAFGYFHVELNTPYLAEYASLRDGSMKVIDSTGGGMQGLVTFPSLHMALAVLLPYAARGLPLLFPLLLGINILVMITTPAIGGHYFADLWGGAALAFASIWIVRTGFTERLLAQGLGKKQQKNTRGKRKFPPRKLTGLRKP